MPQRKEIIHVYLNTDEKKRIQEEADKLGISLSSYIKVKLFSRGMIE